MECYIMDKQYPLRHNRCFDLFEIKNKISKILGIKINRISKTPKCTLTGATENFIIRMNFNELAILLKNKTIERHFNIVSTSIIFKYNCFCTILRIDDELLDFLEKL